MKRYHKMRIAGYEHVSCNPKTHKHRLKNLQTREIEIWVSDRYNRYGIAYKNTYLVFEAIEDEYYKGVHDAHNRSESTRIGHRRDYPGAPREAPL